MMQVEEQDDAKKREVYIPPIAEHLRILSEKQAAALEDEHVQTWRKRRREGKGPPFVRIGANRIGYRLGDLQAWQDQRRTA